MAIILKPLDSIKPVIGHTRRKVPVFDLRELCYAPGTCDWDSLLCADKYNTDDIDVIYRRFLAVVHSLVSMCILAAIRPRDPDFVTPHVKLMLQKRCRLRRQGRTVEANLLADKINAIITGVRDKRSASGNKSSTKELWASVRGKNKTGHKQLNHFYARQHVML